MSSIPIIYKAADPGAPATTGHNNALYEVLRACLVDGYAGKSAAGWAAVYDEWSTTGIASFTNAAQSGVLGVIKEASSSYSCTLFVADAMSDAWHAVNARSANNVVTDMTTLVASGLQQRFGYQSSMATWCVIANENVALIWFANADQYLYDGSIGANWSSLSFLYAGSANNMRSLGGVSDATLGNFITVGGYKGGAYSGVGLGTSQGTVLYDHSDTFNTAPVYQTIWPYSVGIQPPYASDYAGSVIAMNFFSTEIWTGASSSASAQFLLCTIPMMLTSYYFGGNINVNISPLISPDLLTTTVSVAGKNGYLCPLPLTKRAFISMEPGDWL